MSSHCSNCGTRLERNGVCSNCDEASFIMDWQSEHIDNPSDEFQQEAADGYKRAEERINS